MKIRKALLMVMTPLIILGLASGEVLGLAQTENPAETIKGQTQAMDVVNRMADFLASSQRFTVTADMGFDAVQDSGQKIEFGETRKITLDRPGRIRIDEIKRNGKASSLTYDSEALSLLYEKENVYASVPRPGTVDDIIRYLIDDLDLRLPLAEMFSTRLKDVLNREVREAAFVEESSVAGVACDQVALRGDEVDLQIWVAKGEKPLPQRIVITYKKDRGAPQFWAQFSDWNMAPAITDTVFAFTPPPGAKKIAFSPIEEGGKPEKASAQKEVKP